MLSLVLASAGWATAEAADGAAGLKQVAAVQPAAIIADTYLSGITNAEFVQAVRQSDAPGACIILMSAYPRPRWAMEDYFLPKPLHFDRLLSILEEVRAAS
jgi:CheY-like chemotaxis protein